MRFFFFIHYHMAGEFRVCRIRDLKITQFKVKKPEMPILDCISYDGCYISVTDAYRRNPIYVIDILKAAT